MSKTIIAGSNENEFFLKVVKNLTLQKKYKVLLEVSGEDFQDLIEKIINSEEDLLLLNLKKTIQFRFGWQRNSETKKLKRCENLSQDQICLIKEVIKNTLSLSIYSNLLAYD